MGRSGAVGAGQQFSPGGTIHNQVPHLGEAVGIFHPLNQLRQRPHNVRAEPPLVALTRPNPVVTPSRYPVKQAAPIKGQAMTIDTLAAAKALERAGMANGQAEAVANVVRDATADLATKADLNALEGRLNERLAAHEGKLDARLAAHQDILDERLAALEARLMGALHNQKAELMDALRQQAMTFLKTTLAAVGVTAGVVSGIATIVVKLLG